MPPVSRVYAHALRNRHLVSSEEFAGVEFREPGTFNATGIPVAVWMAAKTVELAPRPMGCTRKFCNGGHGNDAETSDLADL